MKELLPDESSFYICTLKIVMKFLFVNFLISIYKQRYAFFVALALSFSVTATEKEIEKKSDVESVEQRLKTDIAELDRRFKQLSFKIYQELTTNSKHSELKFSTMAVLDTNIRQALVKDSSILAISLIHINLQLIVENINEPTIPNYIKLLLDGNEYETANQLFQLIKDDGDELYIATTSVLFASYHSQRNEWQEILATLNIDLSELPAELLDRAYMLIGTALQHLRSHRNAVKIYEKIPDDSKDYPLAQLNIAVAHIRQDWWTDAHIVMNQLLKNGQVTQNEELVNRLHLMLGYSLLNKEFFREARESFRNVGVNSQYTNKALMGISLSAISQKDFNGAIHTLSILKEKKSKPLVVEESHLLLPHVYKMLEQYQTANTGYAQAIDYYQKRLMQLEAMISNDTFYNLDNTSLIEDSIFIMTDSAFQIDENYPPYFMANYLTLKELSFHSFSSETTQELTILIKDYSFCFNKAIKTILMKRIAQIESYLSQARYSLAKLYDNNNE